MSVLTITKISVVLAGILLWPSLSWAKTISFNDITWDIELKSDRTVSQPYIRSDFLPIDFVRSSIFNNKLSHMVYLYNESAIATINKITEEVDQVPVDAYFVLENKKAKNFNPGQNGQTVNLYDLLKLLNSGQKEISLPVMISEPKIKLGDTNQLGIKELVGIGVSDFTGSRNNRTTNIKAGASRYNGLILGPGEEFSFNANLGDVDAANGFLPELVIKPEGLTLEFGGGLCQVSTTAFRAAMNAGLPITQRRNHSFAVQYYAPQGTDATIYPGSSDLKFINDLPNTIVIHTKIVGSKLYFEYYGTRDDRSVAFDGPTVYDKKPDGSMKAVWTRHVTLNNQTTTQTFNSKYLPPALFPNISTTQAQTPNPTPQASVN